jgi:hypothetical protein
MASKHEKRSSSALDPMMAGFAAGAAAFIIYAMPQAHFDQAVSLSGLPMVLSAAQPPLGMTARFAAMAAAGIGSFLLVWLVLRALSKPAPKPKLRSGPVPIEIAPPKLRRADAHPDAPSRRPILAGVDLGRPFDEVPVSEHDSFDQIAGKEDQPLGALVAEEEQPGDSSRDSSGDNEDRETHELPAQGDRYVDPYVDHYVDPYEDHFRPAHDPQPAGTALEQEPEQVDEWLPSQEAGLDEVGFDGLGSTEEEQEFAGDDLVADFERGATDAEQELAEDAPVAGFPVREAPTREEPYEEVPLDLSPREAQTVHALSQRLAEAEDDRAGTIPHLMERLEAGLRRRQPTGWLPSAAAAHSLNGAGPASGEAPPQLDARLRGAIQELQKLAARGN